MLRDRVGSPILQNQTSIEQTTCHLCRHVYAKQEFYYCFLFCYENSCVEFVSFNVSSVSTERSGKLTVATLRALCKQFEVSLKDEEILAMVRQFYGCRRDVVVARVEGRSLKAGSCRIINAPRNSRQYSYEQTFLVRKNILWNFSDLFVCHVWLFVCIKVETCYWHLCFTAMLVKQLRSSVVGSWSASHWSEMRFSVLHWYRRLWICLLPHPLPL